jgi:cellulose synthase operon protein YhjU
MGAWSFYFLAKFYLHFRGYIQFDFILNLLFMIFLLIPVPASWKAYKSWAAVKQILGVILGVLLLWHDSWLPPLWGSISFLWHGGMPQKEYVYRFILGFFSLREVAMLLVILAVVLMIRNRVRLTPVVLLLIFFIPLQERGGHKGEMDHEMDRFYTAESARAVRLEDAKTTGPDFDIVVLHVCSLSWEDLKGSGHGDDPFFSRLDYLFTDFNSVTSYSNPSAIRLLRADCGQPKHDDLYNDAARGCYLFDALRRQGYQTYFTLNHDGVYGNFASQVRALGHLDPPILPAAEPVRAYDFDGSPIFDDYAVLENWWKIRQASGAPRAAVYYNTISLHDGAHGADDKAWWKKDRVEQYREAVRKLFANLTRFFELTASSGRRVVVLFVPEHGMALHGTRLQAPGLREIPLPEITTVPVGVKLIGPGFLHDPSRQTVVTRPTSYLALSYLTASFLNQNPFAVPSPPSAERAASLPETAFVSENQGVLIVRKGSDYFLYGKDKKWIALPTHVRL